MWGICRLCALLVVLVVGATAAQAGEYSWSGTDGDWSNAANWGSSGPPGSGDNAYVVSSGTPYVVNITGDANAAYLGIGATNLTHTNVYDYLFGTAQSPTTGSYNSVVVTGNLKVSDGSADPNNDAGAIMLGYRATTATNNKLDIDGGSVTAGWLVPCASDSSVQVLVHNGGELRLTRTHAPWPTLGNGSAGGELGDSIIQNGTFEINNGRVTIDGGLSFWTFSGSYPTANLKGGTLTTRNLRLGYGVALNVGDDDGQTMELHMTGGFLTPWGHDKDPGGYGMRIKSDGVLSGNVGYIMGDGYYAPSWGFTNAFAKGQSFLVESDGHVAPSSNDGLTEGTICVGSGTLKFESGSNLDIDLFSAGCYDKLTAATDSNFVDDATQSSVVVDLRLNNALQIESGAKLNITSHYATPLTAGMSWNILTWNDREGIFQIVGDTGDDDLGFGMAYHDPNSSDPNGVGTLFTAVWGDATRDNKVEAADLAMVAFNWNKTGMSWCDGDFTGDGQVEAADLAWLAANWNYGVGGAGASFTQAWADATVPEPTTLALLGLGGLGLLRSRRRSYGA